MWISHGIWRRALRWNRKDCCGRIELRGALWFVVLQFSFPVALPSETKRLARYVRFLTGFK